MLIVGTTTQNLKLYFLSSGDELSEYKLNLSIKTSIGCQNDTKTASKKSRKLIYQQGYSSAYVLRQS